MHTNCYVTVLDHDLCKCYIYRALHLFVGVGMGNCYEDPNYQFIGGWSFRSKINIPSLQHLLISLCLCVHVVSRKSHVSIDGGA